MFLKLSYRISYFKNLKTRFNSYFLLKKQTVKNIS